MKTKKKLLGAITSFAAASACLVGGTYAWFVVSSTAEATVTGTVASIDNVNIGIKSAVKLDDAANIDIYTDSGFANFAALDLIADDGNSTKTEGIDEFIYWAEGTQVGEKTGKFASGVIEFVAVNNGHSKVFTPVTTGKYVDDADIKLGKGLDAVLGKTVRTADGTTLDGYTAALDTDYMKYTLVFETPEPLSKIHLRSTNTKIAEKTTSNTNIENSIRVGFEGTTTTIFNPSKAEIDVVTNVGGRMDLNGDQVWDYYELGGNKFEIFYGESAVVTTDAATYADPATTAANIYGIVYSTTAAASGAEAPEAIGTNSNFLGTTGGLEAVTLKGAYVFASAPTPATQAAHGLGYYLPGQTELITTEASGLGELTITTWVEGWDPACTNDISTKDFELVLGFVAVLA